MIFTFTLQDKTGARLTGQSPTFLQFKDVTNLAAQFNLEKPAVVEIGNGDYGFSFDAGWSVVSFLIDGGANANPRYQSATFDMRLESGLLNRMVVNQGSSKLEIYDETGTIKSAEWPLTDSAGNAINLQSTTQPCNRGSGTKGVPLAINFQPAVSDVPVGYAPDSGLVFDAGRGYGWTVAITNSRDRASARPQILDTFVYHSTPARTFRWLLPNGTYDIFYGSGDATNAQGPHRLVIGGTTVINDVSTGINVFIEGSIRLTVSGNELQVLLGGSAGNSCLNYLRAVPV
jgi:hypothetical protein